MRLCTTCLHTDERKVEHCPNCGGQTLSRMTRQGAVVTIPAAAEMPCQECFEAGRALKFRGYRRVLAYLFGARIYGQYGYFCSSCRWKLFAQNQAITLVAGWWGILSAVLYNPFAILVNSWALLAGPFDPGSKGAIDVDDLRESARESERLADVYARMPTWVESLSDEELSLISAETDYYAVLRLNRTATEAEVKATYRTLIKQHHPDVTQASDAHDRTVELNNAHRVLSEARLRYAYDHIDELVAAYATSYTANGGEDTYGADDTYVDGARTADRQQSEASTGSRESKAWRCRFCDSTFGDYDDALRHADMWHPDRVAVDPHRAVEEIHY